MSPSRQSLAVLTAVLVFVSVAAVPVAASVSLTGSAQGGSTQAGGTVTVTFTIANEGNESATGPALDVTLPDGWSVASHADDGGTYKSSTNQWVWLSIGAGSSKSPSLTLNVPANATSGDHTITADVIDGNSNVVDTVNATVTVTSPLSVAADDVESHPNESATVTFTITNDGDSDASAPALRLTAVPANWTISGQSGAGTWKSSNNTFIYLSVGANSSVESSLTFDIPAGAKLTGYTVSAELLNGDNEKVDSIDVTVDVVRNVAKEYDGDKDGVEVTEVQKGIEDWLTGESDLTLKQLQRLIEEWASG